MDRARLAILALCALFSTTLIPVVSDPQPVASRPNVSAPPPAVAALDRAHNDSMAEQQRPVPVTATAEPSADDLQQGDEHVVDQILKRLLMRHTGLAPREQVALAHAIVREARVRNLEPGLVMAVIEVESAGYHLAVSHVGAMGLMQLLPSTGKELAARLDIEWKGADTLFDPIINIKLGTAYLRQLADRFGNVNTALAAYNWGPGRIGRRIRRGATVPSKYIEQVMRAADRNSIAVVSRS